MWDVTKVGSAVNPDPDYLVRPDPDLELLFRTPIRRFWRKICVIMYVNLYLKVGLIRLWLQNLSNALKVVSPDMCTFVIYLLDEF